MGNFGNQVGAPVLFHLHIALRGFLDVLGDHQLAEFLQVRKTFEEQDPVDQLVGTLHLLDRFLVFDLVQLLETPILEHTRMQEVLVDRRQLIFKDNVEMLYDFLVAFRANNLSVGNLIIE